MNAGSKFLSALLFGALLISACLPSETTVSIVRPTDGEKVEQTATVNGKSQLLPENHAIWLVVYLPVTGRYYPQNFPADIQANGEWSATAYIGQANESGLDADIIAVAADQSGQAAFNAYLSEARNKNDFPGLERLPEGAVIYDRVSVERK